MTIAVDHLDRERNGSASRVLNIARIQLVHWPTALGVPWSVLGMSFLINLLIFSQVDDPQQSKHTTGALASILCVMIAVYLMTITQTFPFAVSLSATRRSFFAATVLVMTAHAALAGVLLTALKAVEDATGGWGIRLRFFDLPFVAQHDPVLQALVFAVPLLTMSFLGITLGTVFKRWGQTGLFVVIVGAVLVVGLTVALVIWQHWTHAVGSFFTTQPAFALLAGYPLVLVVALGAVSYRLLLRARL